MRTRWNLAGAILLFWAALLPACVYRPVSGDPTSRPIGVEATVAPTKPSAVCADNLHTPEPAAENGIIVFGCVTDAGGAGVAGVKILRAYASYPGELIAESAEDGSYQGVFMLIPGDEMVRVWAEMPGVSFEPVSKYNSIDGVYYWRHYAGFESPRLDFRVSR